MQNWLWLHVRTYTIAQKFAVRHQMFTDKKVNSDTSVCGWTKFTCKWIWLWASTFLTHFTICTSETNTLTLNPGVYSKKTEIYSLLSLRFTCVELLIFQSFINYFTFLLLEQEIYRRCQKRVCMNFQWP